MENRFDELTKALAEPIPRRQALGRLAGLFGAAVMGALALRGGARAASPPQARSSPGAKGGKSKPIPCTRVGTFPMAWSCPHGYRPCVVGSACTCITSKDVCLN